MADVAKLYELQRIDSTWTKVRNRLQQIRTLLAESDELKTVREQVAAIETEHHKWHADQTNAELESQALVERVRETEARLMSGEIRSPNSDRIRWIDRGVYRNSEQLLNTLSNERHISRAADHQHEAKVVGPQRVPRDDLL